MTHDMTTYRKLRDMALYDQMAYCGMQQSLRRMAIKIMRAILSSSWLMMPKSQQMGTDKE